MRKIVHKECFCQFDGRIGNIGLEKFFPHDVCNFGFTPTVIKQKTVVGEAFRLPFVVFN